METRIRARALTALVAAAAFACAACGHSVEPRAPYDDEAGVPAPQGLIASLDPSGDLRLTWHPTANELAVVDGWSVERRTAGGSAYTLLTPELVRDSVYVDQSVADGARVVYRVFGVTAAAIASAPAQTLPLRCDRTAPATPIAVALAPRPAALELTFTPGGEPDLQVFEVRIFDTVSGQPPVTRAVFGSPALLDGLVPGVPYSVTVAAIDSAGRTSAPSDPPVVDVPD